MSKITYSPAWQALSQHYQSLSHLRMQDLFQADSQRFTDFSLEAAGLLLDFSKNRITHETLSLLENLAETAHLTQQIEQLFSGQLLNHTENRAALHTALRQTDDTPVYVQGENIIPLVRASQQKMTAIVEAITSGAWHGFSGLAITDVVNIGIGGSDLGPAMATLALAPFAVDSIRCHFVSNIDGSQLHETLKNLNPATTLFIVSSKSFTTTETLCNASSAKNWLMNAAGNQSALSQHFLAVTAKPECAINFGIPTKNILPLWDWVGGRYSLWSAVGLPIAFTIGMKNFNALLAGAYAMDLHFRSAPLTKNMPVILALLSIWYTNFFDARTQAILPYDHHLRLLPAYLQQAHMESHGKLIHHDGSSVQHLTGPVIWGGVGTNGQHAFHQLLHQGTQLVPVDFIVAANNHHDLIEHHELLFANCLSQSQALMVGRNIEQVTKELIATGLSANDAAALAPHKVIPGNRPSNTILLSQLTPHSLGALIALYEHKIFAQGVIWQINNFDQWGVELGKALTQPILETLRNLNQTQSHDTSTHGLISFYKKNVNARSGS